MICAILITFAITHSLINVFTAEENPTTIKDYIDVKLLLRSMFLYTSSMYTYHISNTSDLRTVFDPFAVENAVDKVVTFSFLISSRMMGLIDDFDCADISVILRFVRQ